MATEDRVRPIAPTGFRVRLIGGGDLRPDIPGQPYTVWHKAVEGILNTAKSLQIPRKAVSHVSAQDAVMRLVMEADLPDRPPVIMKEIRASRCAGNLDWGWRPDDERPLVIRIMPDFGGAYAWDQDGACIGLAYNFPDVPEVANLEEEIEVWQAEFERADWSPEMPMLPGFDWPPFHQRGLVLTRRLKGLVGDRAHVFYHKPYEDPDHEQDEFLVMVTDWQPDHG